ncbi:MAG: hypothetical protein C0609_02455 [Deltaproteobacteria bacterium]|nr:MAG: hypothetical protein C0609_02455 [Deltaproteobacteria bacterium]
MFNVMKKSLTVKVTFAIITMMIIVFGLLGWYSLRRSSTTIAETEMRWNKHFAFFVDDIMQHYMQDNDPEGLEHFITEASKSSGFKMLKVVNSNKEISFSNDREEIGRFIADTEIAALLLEVERSRQPGTTMDGAISVTAVPLISDEGCAVCHPPFGRYLGTTIIGSDTSEANANIKNIFFEGTFLFIAALLIIIAVLYFSMRKLVLSPLFRLVRDAKKVSQGDLAHRFTLESEDEMRQLADHLETMQSQLRSTIAELADVNTSIVSAIDELDTSSESLVGLSAEQASGAAEQAAAVHEVTASAQEVATTSAQISANVEAIRKMAEDAFDACLQGRKDVKDAIEGMSQVRDKVSSISDATVELGRKSHKIGGVISIIDEISEQTHLLALNAAIEAAGAGEHGKRFGVVATEVRRLAERTVEATAEIKALIEEIQESTNETVMITERGSDIVREGTSKVDLVGDTLDTLSKRVEMTTESAKEMAIATRQQATAGEQLVLTITDINSVAVQVSRAAEKVEKNAMGLKSISLKLKELRERAQLLDKYRL